jgi:hypothetical protein
LRFRARLRPCARHVHACTYNSDNATRLAGVKKPGLPLGVRTYGEDLRNMLQHVGLGAKTREEVPSNG